MDQDFEERLENLFGDDSSINEEKHYRQKEFLRKQRYQKRGQKWDVLIVEIKEAGEIPHVTNVINRCIKKIVREKILIVNAMNLTNRRGHKKNQTKINYKFKSN